MLGKRIQLKVFFEIFKENISIKRIFPDILTKIRSIECAFLPTVQKAHSNERPFHTLPLNSTCSLKLKKKLI